MKTLGYLGFFGVLILFFGCSVQKRIEVAALPLPQDANYFLGNQDKIKLDEAAKKALKHNYLRIWYSPWVNPKPNADVHEVFWIAPNFLRLKGYGPNLKHYSLEELQEIYESMKMDSYPSAAVKAVITRDTAVRAVPTSKPYFKSRSDMAFDRWQNSFIFSGTPVLITHFNASRDWAHIQSSFVYGWVRVEDLARISAQDEHFFLESKNYVVPNHDRVKIYDKEGNFLATAHVGQLFVLHPQKQKIRNQYAIYLMHRGGNGGLQKIPAYVKKEDFSLFPKDFSALKMAGVIDSMLGQFYGWGGELGSRDCSAFIRDSFAGFGIFLPRNSSAQVKYANNMVDLSKMSATQKEKYIIKNATPFATILWLQGHIMLYIGSYEGRAIVAHSVWSVMTQNSRFKVENLLGGAVITTLTPESQKNGTFSKAKTLLDRIKGMSDLHSYALQLTDAKKE